MRTDISIILPRNSPYNGNDTLRDVSAENVMIIEDPLIGKELGDYLIEELLGRGGMARVYRGYDAQLDRYAAVKVIEPNLITGDDEIDYHDRFLREARAIARLNHPRVVGIYQFGQESSLYYMAMVFVEGYDLRHILKAYNKQDQYMSYAHMLRIIRDVAEALDYAHSQGVIHRDVKPSNIMVTADGHAVLTDFGLARSAHEETLGHTFGSAHYIAPEQAISSNQAVPQSDLYSLGVVLYEMLTGRVPFEDDSAMSIALKHVSKPPPSPVCFNPNIPRQVEQVVIKALDKEPNKRFVSGKALVQALESALVAVDDEDTHEFETTSPFTTPGQKHRKQHPPSAGSPGSGERDTILLEDATVIQRDKAGTPISRLSRPGILGLIVSITLVAAALVAASGATDSTNGSDETPATASVSVESTTIRSGEQEVIIPSVSAISTKILTPTSGPMPGATATPALDAVQRDEPQILLRYDNRTLVLYNRSPTEFINISGLEFVRTTSTGRTIRFRAREWGNLEDQFMLQPGDCFQVWTVRFTFLSSAEFPADMCRARQGFFATTRPFWNSSSLDSIFEVRHGDDVLATCPTVSINTEEGTLEVRCLVDLRSSSAG